MTTVNFFVTRSSTAYHCNRFAMVMRSAMTIRMNADVVRVCFTCLFNEFIWYGGV